MNYGGEAWRALWRAIDERRIELGVSWRTYYGWAGISRETIVAMRDGQGIKNAHKLTGIDFASRWQRGSAQRVLEGGEPVPNDSPAATTGSVVGIDEKLDQLLGLVRSLEENVLLIAEVVLVDGPDDPTPAAGSRRRSPSKR